MTVSLPHCGFYSAFTHLKTPTNTDNIKTMKTSISHTYAIYKDPSLNLVIPPPTEFTPRMIKSLTRKGLATSHPTN